VPLDHGLARAAGALEPAERWGLAHDTLRAALRDRAAAADRLAAHHAACVAMLADRAAPRRAAGRVPARGARAWRLAALQWCALRRAAEAAAEAASAGG
jgi:hypothetical protein